MFRKNVVSICMAMLVFSFQAHAAFADEYDRGMEFKKDGNWEEALKIWWQGKMDLERKGIVDPRIGIAFIETATEHGAEKYYGTASDLYFWALSDPKPERMDAILEEAKRVLPLVEDTLKKSMESAIRKKDPDLTRRVRSFWLENDTRPLASGNQRLLEHWERIAYARANYTLNKLSVYGCDDRGLVYVKYGKPTHTFTGRFLISDGDLALMGIKRSSFVTLDIIDNTPRYEMWGYDDLVPGQQPVFLFSHEHGIGQFHLMKGVEDVLPYSHKDRARKGILLLYHFSYYRELSGIHPFFMNRYDRLRNIWMQNSSNKPTLLHHELVEMDIANRFDRAEGEIPPQVPDWMRDLGTVQIDTRFFRRLDGLNEPEILIVSTGSPSIREENLKMEGEAYLVQDCLLRRTFVIRDREANEIGRWTDSPNGSRIEQMVLSLPHVNKETRLTAAMEAWPSAAEPESLYKMLALGTETVNMPDPLENDASRLELSDLFLGIQPPEDPGNILPLIPASKFSREDPMLMYLEVYHLLLDENGKSRCLVEYGVNRLEEKKGKIVRRDTDVRTGYAAQGEGRVRKEILNINIRSLRYGNYEFFVRVTDQASGEMKERKCRFVVEKW